MLAAYLRLLERRPLVTQMISAGVISGAGDILCQFAIEKRPLSAYDPWRTGRFFVLTGGFIAPCLHRWFRFLEGIKGMPRVVPLKRLAVDQTTFSPLFNAIIIFNLRLLEGLGVNESWTRMKHDWWPIYSSSLAVWPAAQLFNFYVVPLHLRVVFVQAVALFWNAFLAYKTQPRHLSAPETSPLPYSTPPLR